MRESEIQSRIRQAINQTDKARVMRNSVGFDFDKRIRYGLGVGSPDLIGVLRNGRVFALECKAKNGRLSTEQAAWWLAARQWGITGGVAKSVEDALLLLEAAL
jgi:hypothetical protein